MPAPTLLPWDLTCCSGRSRGQDGGDCQIRWVGLHAEGRWGKVGKEQRNHADLPDRHLRRCGGGAQLAALAEQPAPAAGMGDIWADIIPDLPAILQPYATERRRQGIERYRTPLQPHNGRDALYDAMQEALDLVVYLRQAEMEEYRRAHLEEISGAMQHALDAAQLIAEMIERRGAK
ncbi:MAG: hypothetical protein EBZ93_09395 [Actinobacteria bacterium]|nr:hypothetical protein [Actinomycetota bacterium]